MEENVIRAQMFSAKLNSWRMLKGNTQDSCFEMIENISKCAQMSEEIEAEN
jgi:hypothetical protein